jgi:hypothetical protein
MLVTCPSHPILLDSITRVKFDDEHTDHKIPLYVVFFNPRPSQAQVTSSALYSLTPPTYVLLEFERQSLTPTKTAWGTGDFPEPALIFGLKC